MNPAERAARALCRHDGVPENIRFEGAPMWRSFLPTAMVAIDALRITDPLSPILAAGGCTRDQWNRMIEAMLAAEIEGGRSAEKARPHDAE